MRLGIYHEPAHTDGRTFDTYGAYARYVLEFAKHFDQVTVLAPVTSKPTYFSGCTLDAPNVNVVPLPFFKTHAEAYRHTPTIARIFCRHAPSLDAVNCRGTAPLAYLLWFFTRRQNRTFVYHFASDPFEVLRTSPRYRGLFGRFARFGYGFEFAIQKHIMRQTWSFASGARLCQRLREVTPNIEPVITSSLLNEDYYLRKDCCTADKLHLLYVGRLKGGKGLDYLLRAVKMLLGAGRNVGLDIVGEGDLRDSLMAFAKELNISEYVHFRGFAVMGPQLNQYYNSADIFILPSLSEGSPKSVLEALGHSLPVVASAVGNVPETLDQGRRGILVKPGDPRAIVEAVKRIMDDPTFRQRCIREGYAYASKHKLENFVAHMAEKIQSLHKSNKGGPR